MIYQGSVADAPQYFQSIGFPVPANCNPADFYLDVAQGAVPRVGYEDFEWPELFDLWEQFRLLNTLGTIGSNLESQPFADGRTQAQISQSGLSRSHSVSYKEDVARANEELTAQTSDYILNAGTRCSKCYLRTYPSN